MFRFGHFVDFYSLVCTSKPDARLRLSCVFGREHPRTQCDWLFGLPAKSINQSHDANRCERNLNVCKQTCGNLSQPDKNVSLIQGIEIQSPNYRGKHRKNPRNQISFNQVRKVPLTEVIRLKSAGTSLEFSIIEVSHLSRSHLTRFHCNINEPFS